MTKSNSYKLIQGQFTPAEAREILSNLIEYKIQFHNLRILESREKEGVENEKSIKRIKELKETKAQILNMLEGAADEEVNLMIDSRVQIEYKNELKSVNEH